MGLRPLLVAFLAPATALAAWTGDLRLRFSASHPDALSPGIQTSTPLSERFRLDAAAQLAFSPKEVRHATYRATVAFSVIEAVNLRAGLFHRWLPLYGAATSGLTAAAEIDTSIAGRVEVFASAGWYERLSRASGGGLLPLQGPGSEREHDFLLRLGGRLRFTDEWAGALFISTEDAYEVFNLNGPYLEAALEKRGTLEWRAYARYHVLLGFGRPGEIAVGFSIMLDR